jgi:hypothetical protein
MARRKLLPVNLLYSYRISTRNLLNVRLLYSSEATFACTATVLPADYYCIAYTAFVLQVITVA